MTTKLDTKKQQQMAAYDDLEIADGGGFEEADSDSFSVPFIKLLQKLSPQVDEDHDDYIEGAKSGMYYNTVTGELFPDGVTVIPCHYTRVFIEWVTREKGGGIVNVFNAADGAELMQSTERDEKNRDILPNGNELQDTRVHYVLAKSNNGDYEPAIISLARTQTKGSKDWMSKMKQWKLPNGKGAAMFAQVWKLGSKKKVKDENTWNVLVAEPVGLINEVFPDDYKDLIANAKSFREMIKSGAAVANHDAVEDDVM